MAAVTEEEIVAIANNFLLSAPPGEFLEVVTDVRGLLADDSLINDTAEATFSKWNTDQMLQVVSPNGGHQVLITKYGEVSDREYVDPRGKCVIVFDHIRQELSSSRALSGELDNSVEDLRSAVDDQISSYVSDHYPNGGVTVYAAKEGGSSKVTICSTSSRFNPANFWNGRWRSIWECTVGSKSVELKGTIYVNVHYFEDGNVQLNTEFKKTLSADGGSSAKAAENIAKVIKKCETEFQNALDSSYQTMGETTFKALRRVLPITRQKVDFPKIMFGTYKVGAEASRR